MVLLKLSTGNYCHEIKLPMITTSKHKHAAATELTQLDQQLSEEWLTTKEQANLLINKPAQKRRIMNANENM